MRTRSLSVSIAFFATLLLGIPLLTQASYLPGETLNPSCLPTDSTCIVTSLTASSTATSFPYYAANGSVLSATTTLTLLTNGNFGIGTTSPYAKLTAWGGGTGTGYAFEIANSASTTLARFLDNGTGYFLGNVGIGTTSPYAKLSVVGETVSSYFTATSTTATTTIAGGLDAGSGRFAYNYSSGKILMNAPNAIQSALELTLHAVGIAQTTSGLKITGTDLGTISNAKGIVLEINDVGAGGSVGISMTGSSSKGIDITSTATAVFKGVSVTNNSINYSGNFFNAQSSSASFPTSGTMFRGLLTGGSTSGKFLSFETVADAGNIFVVNTNGNVGIGTTTPYARLTVWGTDTASTSPFTVANSASTTVFAVYNNGNAIYSGAIFQSSDQRLKTNITPLDAASSLESILSLTPVSYTRLDQSDLGTNLGFIAQDVQQIFPDLVSTSSPTSLTPDGTLTLNYVGLIAPLVEALKALAGEVGSFAQSITTAVVNATTGNFTNVNTDNLCVKKSDGSNVCITGDQLGSLLDKQETPPASAPSPLSPPELPADTPPVVVADIIEVTATPGTSDTIVPSTPDVSDVSPVDSSSSSDPSSDTIVPTDSPASTTPSS